MSDIDTAIRVLEALPTLLRDEMTRRHIPYRRVAEESGMAVSYVHSIIHGRQRAGGPATVVLLTWLRESRALPEPTPPARLPPKKS